ncbi:transposase [Streptomyces sp. NPDC093982]|uniref:transposase n=1 Tax=Streptomyces sp. NPDC093982 TaxID=3155077 RepID=UPI00343037F4
MAPLRPALDLADTIPGINRAVAEVIIAETGADMSRFASAKHLASWAGVCPGNPYLKGAISLAAFRHGENQGHLSAGPLQAADRPPQPPQGPGRRPTLDHYRDLAHALARSGLRLGEVGAAQLVAMLSVKPAARSTRSTSSATPSPTTRWKARPDRQSQNTRRPPRPPGTQPCPHPP